jgi:hypothetical protein
MAEQKKKWKKGGGTRGDGFAAVGWSIKQDACVMLMACYKARNNQRGLLLPTSFASIQEM